MWLISVIVPFYNSVNFLEKAVRSILDQTYANLEIILVDDGSSDGSDLIARNLAKSDHRIKLFAQKNQGVSVARNTGISHATGDYLMFVDADDWIDAFMISDIVKNLEQFKDLDLIRLTNQKVFDRENKLVPDKTYIVKVYDQLSFIKENLLGGYVCSLFIKTSIVKDNNLLFSTDMKLMEDQELSLKCFLHAKHILFYNKPHYFYYQNQQSGSLSSLSNVVTNSVDMLKCGSRVYKYALNVASGELLQMIKKYSLRKINQYLKVNIRHKSKQVATVKNELSQCLQEMGISIYQTGFFNLSLYFIIKSRLRSFLAK